MDDTPPLAANMVNMELLMSVSSGYCLANSVPAPVCTGINREVRAGGDAYVLATLEAIVADPNIFAAAGDVRTALYRFS